MSFTSPKPRVIHRPETGHHCDAMTDCMTASHEAEATPISFSLYLGTYYHRLSKLHRPQDPGNSMTTCVALRSFDHCVHELRADTPPTFTRSVGNLSFALDGLMCSRQRSQLSAAGEAHTMTNRSNKPFEEELMRLSFQVVKLTHEGQNLSDTCEIRGQQFFWANFAHQPCCGKCSSKSIYNDREKCFGIERLRICEFSKQQKMSSPCERSERIIPYGVGNI